MTFSEWLAKVEATMHDHPDWLKDTQLVIMAGLQRRLAEEADLRTRAEVALIIAYDSGKPRIPEHQRELVVNALRNAAVIAGTPYQAALDAAGGA
jgi:hypothetical protein